MRKCCCRALVPGRVDPLATTPRWSVALDEVDDEIPMPDGPGPSPDPGPCPGTGPSPGTGSDPEGPKPRLNTGRRKAIPSNLISWSYVDADEEG